MFYFHQQIYVTMLHMSIMTFCQFAFKEDESVDAQAMKDVRVSCLLRAMIFFFISSTKKYLKRDYLRWKITTLDRK